jgi:sigma-B regulation protein RsbU (phosphoserine phosphatase)
MRDATAGAREFFDVYTKDLKASDLQRLFTRDAREAYEFFARGVDRTSFEGLPAHKRIWAHLKIFFLAFTMRLSPARRALYAVAVLVSTFGLLKLFSGFASLQLPGTNFFVMLPFPEWHDGTLFLVTGFILLNLLVILEVADRLSLKHDLNVARDIQLAMLPQGTYRSPGMEAHGETRPANTVGGDFYDLVPLEDGRLVLALGDVAGKGSPAALLMALLLAMLRTLLQEGLEPGPMLERINTQVLRHAPGSRFVTLFLAIVDPGGRMTWVNAGQNPPHIRRADGRIETLPATAVALGMFPSTTYASQETMIEPGDLLVAYSDGITEAENPEGQPFDEAGLDGIVEAWAPASTPEITTAVLAAVTRHVQETRFADDLTILVLKRS